MVPSARRSIRSTCPALVTLLAGPAVPARAVVTLDLTPAPEGPFDAAARTALDPFLPPRLVDLVLAFGRPAGAPGLDPAGITHPFFDIATARAFGDPQRTGAGALGPDAFDDKARPFQCHGLEVAQPVAGYGRRLSLSWPPGPASARQLLTLTIPSREPDASFRREVTGETSVDLVLTEDVRRCVVETLDGAPGAWSRTLHYAFPQIRGVLPFAGQPGVAPGHRDGTGGAARLHTPFGMAVVPEGAFTLPGLDGKVLAAVADQGAHTVSLLTFNRELRRLCGTPGRPGHGDGPWAAAQFHGPTFVLSLPAAPGAEAILVADSGNHCLRKITADGRVTTLAGTPGLPGDQDHPGDPLAAGFHDPRGLALDAGGAIYVADRGNHRIRMIRDGRVSTIAGRPGPAGHRDGAGAEARFQDLQGLAWDPDSGALYAADGHCIRRLRPGADGSLDFQVDTVLGSPVGPGFALAGDPPGRCLNGPTGIAFHRGKLYIADTGNRALRVFLPASGRLWTAAGGPEAPPKLAWGLCRDDLPWFPQAAEYASLDQPRAFLPAFPDGTRQGVLTGTCVAQVPLGEVGLLRSQALGQPLHLTAADAVALGEPLVASLELASRAGLPADASFRYLVEFHDARGGREHRFQGEHRFDQPLRLTGEFGERGEGTVTASVVDPFGLSWGVRRKVRVE